MGWIILTGYVIGALWSARRFYVTGFETDYEDSKERQVQGGEEKWIELAREYGLKCSLFGIIWPITWLTLVIMDFLTRPTPVEQEIAKKKRTQEHEEKVRAEMIRQREWYEDNKMEAPDTSTLRFMAERVVKNDEH